MKLKDKLTAKIPEQKREKIKKTLNVLRIIKNIVCWTLIIILSFAVITFLLTRFTVRLHAAARVVGKHGSRAGGRRRDTQPQSARR